MQRVEHLDAARAVVAREQDDGGEVALTAVVLEVEELDAQGLQALEVRRCRIQVGVEERLELELKEIEAPPSGDKLWQVGNNRPLQQVTISPEARARGFVTVGRLVIDKRGESKTFTGAAGWFLPEHEPQRPEAFGPFGASAPPSCSSSTEMPSGDRTNAMWPSRGGRLIATPPSISRWQVS